MKLVWSRRAVAHLAALRRYIERDNPPAARDVAEQILRAVELLQTQPHMGRAGRVLGTRELVVSGTPFLIPYRVRGERLELIAVFHGRQNWGASGAYPR
jgi:toxin ParE1/3/4